MIVRNVQPGGLIRVSHTFTERLGLTGEELIGSSIADCLHPDDRSDFQMALETGGDSVRALHRTDGERWEMFSWKLRIEEEGPVALGILSSQDDSDETITRLSGEALPDTMWETLREMALMVEDQFPTMLSSIILVDASGRVDVGAGPNLPQAYNDAVSGLMIGPGVGSCGTASYWNVPVVVEGIQNDILWRDLRGAAAEAGVASCWSNPITTRDGQVVGALAVYNREPRIPTDQELRGLRAAARMDRCRCRTRSGRESATRQRSKGATTEPATAVRL